MANALGKVKTSTGPWITVAVILVAGFMYWLYAASSSIESGTIVADTVESIPRVTATDFVIDPTQFSRERILLSPLTVAERIGRAALTVDMPGLAGYPLILERSVVESELTVVRGDQIAIAGQVYALNDSLLDVYAQRGFFQPENRPKIEGHSTFFLVDSLDFVFPGTDTSGGNPSS
ncbi:MAG: hypothetical protein JSU87_08480 [Gemmatimonadota bacterium]|nr:MAG: hypothetical protein JSU87_08480 [Gemmatimonadota bacterium]